MTEERNRAYYRHHRRRMIRRKCKIYFKYWKNDEHLRTPDRVGQFAKGKVHCSCPTCSGPNYKDEPKRKDQGRLEEMKNQLKEYVY